MAGVWRQQFNSNKSVYLFAGNPPIIFRNKVSRSPLNKYASHALTQLFESLQEHSFLHLTLCWSTFIGTLFCTINFASVYVLYCVLYYSRCLVLRFIGAPFCSITLSCSTFYWSTVLFNHVVLFYVL